ncbi:hypothetical protein ACFVMC_30720 [Nocardia sp. NPDC127579]|uniref:hypothetical protein n=1 Tax=Nocardia sp. NPDC127579 TaxID=3345402 RepID=UPI00362DB37C
MDHSTVEAALAGMRATDSRALERDCDRLAQQYLAQRVEPQFEVGSADFDTDPYLICADRYWNHRFRAEPTLRTAVECAGWLSERVAAEHRAAIREKWALGYAFITRDAVETASEIADATRDIVANDDSACGRAYFVTLYHAGKLRANLWFDELAQFLDSSPLAVAAGSNRDSVLFKALRSFAAFGSRRVTDEYARILFDEVWQTPERTFAATDVALNGLAVSVPFDGRGELLRDRAAEAVTAYPGSHILRFRLAAGRYRCGEHDDALAAVDAALRLLPASGWRVSHELLQGQYLALRDAIEIASKQAEDSAAEREKVRRHEAAIAELAATIRGSLVRAVELVSVFAAVIAFAVGSLNVSLNGNLNLSSRLWIVAALGLGLEDPSERVPTREQYNAWSWPRWVAPIVNDGSGVFGVPGRLTGALAAASDADLAGVAARWAAMLERDADGVAGMDPLAVVRGVARLARVNGRIYCAHSPY